MRTYRIVTATPADYPAIERIARQTWPVTFGSILSIEQIEYMLEMMYRPEALRAQVSDGHVFHLLLDPLRERETYSGYRGYAHRPVAYVSHQRDYLPGITKIHKLYVLPGTQGRGFGRALVRCVEGIARRAGQQALRLDVNFQNPAVDFYERIGFRKLERYDTDIGNGYLMEDWRMEKSL